MSTPTETNSAPAAAVTEAPLDANTTRGAHLQALLRHPVAIAATVVAVAAAGGITGVLAGLGPGAGGAAGALLLAALVLWIIADARAAEDFFRAYARARSLATGGGRSHLPGATSLLRKGLRRYTERTFAGKLAGRADGLLALYTYETEYTDSKGNRHTQYHHFTVAMIAVPAANGFLSECACQRRAGFRFFDKAEDAFRSRQRVELESEEVDRRYEIFIGAGDDQNCARQLFSPSFIDWLATGDEDMGWELEAGMLVVNVPGHQESAAALDVLSAAAATVAERITEEATEPGGAPEPGASSFSPASYVVAESGGGPSGSLKKRLWALCLLLCIGAGVSIGFATGGEGGGGSDDSVFESGGVEFGSPRLAARDDVLLPVILREDRGKGVHTEDLYGHGVPPGTVDDWISDAFVRDLVDFDSAEFTLVLTPKGEREAKRAR
jgi:hypothetical protein